MKNAKFLAIALLLGLCSKFCLADDEEERRDAPTFEQLEKKGFLSEAQRKKEQAEKSEQIKHEFVEIQKRAKQLASEGREEEANALMEKLQAMKEQLVREQRERDAAPSQAIQQLELERFELLQRYGSEHPKVKSLEDRLNFLRKQFTENGEHNERERRAKLMHEAAQNLQAAGLTEQAEHIRRQAEAFAAADKRGPAAEEVRELQNQVRQLAERVERLETMLRRITEAK